MIFIFRTNPPPQFRLRYFLYDFRILDLPPPLQTRLSHSLYDFFFKYCSYTPLYAIPTTCLIYTHYFPLYGHNDMLLLL